MQLNDMTNTFAVYVDVVGEGGETLSDSCMLLDHVGWEWRQTPSGLCVYSWPCFDRRPIGRSEIQIAQTN